jgi:hypothetical protein
MENVMRFDSAEDMLTTIQMGKDLYNPQLGLYVFLYSEVGSIAVYNISIKKAEELKKTACGGEISYWSDALGRGGEIYDAPKSESFDMAECMSNLEWCEEYYYHEGWKRIMKYFVTNNEREGTCYHEFFLGSWDEQSFWKNDSIYLDDDILTMNLGFYEALKKVVPTYDPYNETEFSREDWENVRKNIPGSDIKSLELYAEADEWAQENFKRFSKFTIIGI